MFTQRQVLGELPVPVSTDANRVRPIECSPANAVSVAVHASMASLRALIGALVRITLDWTR
jgi:hypothetical protein